MTKTKQHSALEKLAEAMDIETGPSTEAQIQQLRNELQEIRDTYQKRLNEEVTNKSSSHLLEEISEHAKDISSFKLSQFHRENLGGQEERARYFYGEKETIAKILELANFTNDCPYPELKALPDGVLSELATSFYHVKSCLHEMRDHADGRYKGVQGDSKKDLREIEARKNKLITKLNPNYKRFYEVVQPIKNNLNRQEVSDLKQEVIRLRDENTKQGIERYHRLFSKQAESHSSAAKQWLIAGAATVALNLLCVGWLLITVNSTPQDTYLLIHSLTLKLVLLGLFSFSAIWCFKNFKINKHNELLNRQKELSLRTFSKFTNSTGPEDKELRSVILNKITATIFDPQPLGYLQTNDEKLGNFTFSPVVDAVLGKQQ